MSPIRHRILDTKCSGKISVKYTFVRPFFTEASCFLIFHRKLQPERTKTQNS